MKNKLLIIISILFFNLQGSSQDLILLRTGDTIETKIKEIGINEIRYNRYDNLEGTTHLNLKEEVLKVIFENGSTETYENEAILSKEKLKKVIVEYFNKYSFVWRKENPYHAKFEGDYLRLTKVNRRTGEHFPQSTLYDFTGKCIFQRISLRPNDGFINVIVPYFKRGKIMEGYKLVIGVKGINEPKVLYDALVNYNKLFND